MTRQKAPVRRCSWHHCAQPAAATVAFKLPNLLAGTRRDYCREHTRQVSLAKGTVVVARFGRRQPSLATSADANERRRAGSTWHMRRKGWCPEPSLGRDGCSRDSSQLEGMDTSNRRAVPTSPADIGFRNQEGALPTMTTATVRLAPPQPSHDLAAALAEVDRHLGVGVATTLDDPAPMGTIPTGSLALDLALGVGGIPRGRITEVYGPEGAGKTTLALSVIARAQAAGASACYIDTEHALDPQWAAATGVDLSRLALCQPEHGEQALQVASLLINSGAVAVLVLDSIAALIPRAELAAEIGERLPGVQAHLLSQELRQLCRPIARSGTAVLVTNQLRQRAGAPGAPVYTAGGRALGYYASVRLDVRRLQAVKEGGRVVGSRLRVLVAKNKLGPAGQTAELEIREDCGVCEPTGRQEEPTRAAS